MSIQNVLNEGKTKFILSTEKSDEVIIRFKDDVVAFSGVKKAVYENKGILTNRISSIIYKYLMSNKIKTHLLSVGDRQDQLCKKVDIFEMEFVCRNVIANARLKGLGLKEGTVLKEPILEIRYKKDMYNEVLINDDHAFALNLIEKQKLEYCYDQMIKINELLVSLFNKVDITLVDFRVEFGTDNEGEIILAGEISPDNCRLWETSTGRKLDKDVFRRDLGNITDTYQLVLSKLESLNI